MKKSMKGSFTIEAAVIVPLILFIFGVLMHILFYWHDKNILFSTAHEVAALGSSRTEMAEIELEYYFFSRIEGKLLLFERVECMTEVTEDKVSVSVDGSKGKMTTKVTYDMARTSPENYIREVRKLEKLGEEMVSRK